MSVCISNVKRSVHDQILFVSFTQICFEFQDPKNTDPYGGEQSAITAILHELQLRLEAIVKPAIVYKSAKTIPHERHNPSFRQ